MKKIISFFTGKNLLFSIGISLAGYLIGSLLKELIDDKDRQFNKFYQLDDEEQKAFIASKEELN